MKRFFYFLILALISTSCIEEIPLQLTEQQQQFVVNGLITNDQICKVYLSKTIPITESKYPVVDDAKIKLIGEVDGEVLDSLSYYDDFSYQGTQPISLYNTPLKLEIALEGKTVSAHTYIPQPVPIISATSTYPAGYDQYGDGMTEYTVTFQDPAEEQNYYELFFFNYSYSEEFHQELSTLLSNEDLAYIDPVIQSEGLEDYGNKSLLFSDRLINGDEAKIVVKYLPQSPYGSVGSLVDTTQIKELQTYALLRTVSKEYYEYRKSWTIHQYTQQNKPAALEKDAILEDFSRFLFVGDPVEMNTSIENGVGVFAGYSQSLKEIQP